MNHINKRVHSINQFCYSLLLLLLDGLLGAALLIIMLHGVLVCSCELHAHLRDAKLVISHLVSEGTCVITLELATSAMTFCRLVGGICSSISPNFDIHNFVELH